MKRTGGGVGEGNISDIVRQARDTVVEVTDEPTEKPQKTKEKAQKAVEIKVDTKKGKLVKHKKEQASLMDTYATSSDFLNEQTLGNIKLIPLDFEAPNIRKLIKPEF